VITGFGPVDVILAEELNGAGKNRDLRIPAVIFPGRVGRVETDPQQNVKDDQANKRAQQEAASHRKKARLRARR
jgi:hypothetical protein